MNKSASTSNISSESFLQMKSDMFYEWIWKNITNCNKIVTAVSESLTYRLLQQMKKEQILNMVRNIRH